LFTLNPEGSLRNIVGHAYAWNTLGAILALRRPVSGSCLACGSFHLLAATAAVNLTLAAAISVASVPRRLLSFAVNAALLIAVDLLDSRVIFTIPPWPVVEIPIHTVLNAPRRRIVKITRESNKSDGDEKGRIYRKGEQASRNRGDRDRSGESQIHSSSGCKEMKTPRRGRSQKPSP